MTRSMIRALLWAIPTLLLAACGSSEQKCFEDRGCAAGFRCALPEVRGNPGVCKPCDAAEVPYDGVDNDCNARTKDSDLDGDEDNAKTAAIDPGGDCDDQDPSVSSKELEVCGDQKDNNCDGRVDERECGDRQPPSIQLISPTEGSTVSGVVRVEASAQDDIGVARVEFFVSGGAVLATDDSAPFEAMIDTRTFTDGSLDVSARAVDLLGKTSQASVRVFAENHTGPRITFVRPTSGLAYGGRMTIMLGVRDPDGVVSTTVKLDNNVVLTSSSASLSTVVDTRTLTEGNHTLDISSVDRVGSTSQVTRSFLVNNQLPAVHIAPPTGGTTVRNMVSFTITATAAGTFDIGFEGQSSQTSPFTAPIDTTMYLNGPRIMTATVTDHTVVDDGNSPSHSAYDQLLITVNNMGAHGRPEFHITAPRDGDYVYLNTPITATLLLNGTMVDHVDLIVNGQFATRRFGPPYNFEWDFRNYTGAVTIELQAYDQATLVVSDSVHCPVMSPARFSQQRDYANLYSFRYDVGDLNLDGIPDLATCGSVPTVHLSAGMPYAAAFQRLEVNLTCDRARIGEVTGDATIDIITNARGVFAIYELQSDGTYVRDSAKNFNAGLTVEDFSLADVDGDGDKDIVGVGSVGAFFVMLQTRVGFAAPQIFGAGAASTYAIFDLDGDGDLDVVTQAASITPYLNDGHANFTPGQGFASGPVLRTKVAAGDVNGDGVGDIVAVNDRTLYVALGSASDPRNYTTVTSLPLAAAGRSDLSVTQSIIVADFDADGAAEVIVNTSGVLDVVRVAAGQLDCMVARGAQSPQDDSEMLAADFNNDGHLDLFTGDRVRGSFLYARPDGSLSGATCLAAPGDAVGATDVTADGIADVVVARNYTMPNSSDLALYTVSANSMSLDRTMPLALAQSRQIVAGELGGGGGGDLAVSGHTRVGAADVPSVNILVQQAGQTFAGFVVTAPDAIADMAIGDVDGDGQNDLVCGSGFLSVINPSSQMITSTPLSPAVVGIALADIDVSGPLEVLTVDRRGAVVVYDLVNPSTRSFIGLPAGSDIAVCETAPADGRPDVVVHGGTEMAILRGDQSTLLGPATRYSMGTAGSGTKMLPFDFNHDGLTDLAVSHRGALSDDVMIVLANPQGGYFRPDYISCPAIKDLAVGDFDGDGDGDIACVGSVVELIVNETP